MKNDGKDLPNKIQYNIWDTRTEENLQTMKKEFAEEIEHTNFKSNPTNQKKQP
ncbi:hypothetical protein KW850_15785 [Bacillus sp. sid0103]|uniref:hypothetical protein n=1 Tax=Bacillus sp. sid0103 TaxID=2856337 RepID=UPI001C48732D|nr:hypothetical protein [Bacillus sp. sid0103]MBV7506726.1 hypothetical protein [Bacillus sp. sid0103]